MADTKRTPPPPDVGCFGGLKRRFPILEKKRGKAIAILILILPLFGLLGLLALRNRDGSSTNGAVGDGTGSEAVITDDTHFYGYSEAVYPARK
jgi:beta-glucosidase